MDKLRYFLESRFADSHTVRGFHYFLIGISGIPVFGFRFGVPGIGIQNSELPTPPLLLFCRNASTDHSKATMRTKKWEKYESQESRAVMDCPRMGGRGALYCILWLIYSRFNKKTFLRRPRNGHFTRYVLLCTNNGNLRILVPTYIPSKTLSMHLVCVHYFNLYH